MSRLTAREALSRSRKWMGRELTEEESRVVLFAWATYENRRRETLGLPPFGNNPERFLEEEQKDPPTRALPTEGPSS